MSNKAFSFPEPSLYELSTFDLGRADPSSILLNYVRERARQAKYPSVMLAELYAAGEITREQYERLRREEAGG